MNCIGIEIKMKIMKYDVCLPRFFLFFCFSGFFIIYLLLAVLGLRCCAWAFSSCGEWGSLFVAVRGLLIMVASLVEEHGL